ncbi:TIGR04104 family putative zinc finger protein [Pseudalkalibacillus caeni]|uniref:Cxxc_20_cxxc protein n=1 Tax=Exobacillus caeni TaxID=2574798 RepID=A0A5R9F220_9BACL|nr:hypothetical protein FCL54_11320 [Pseudalkalibacillus caeni]
MPACQNCGYTWKRKETTLKMLTFKSSYRCPNCLQKQYLSAETRKRSSLYSLPFFLIIPFLAAFNIHFSVTLVIAVVYLVFYISYLPFTIKLSNENEPLW